MKPYYEDESCMIYHGDCREIVPALIDCPRCAAGEDGLICESYGHTEPKVAADLLLTDPPYSLSVTQDHKNRPGRGTRRLNFFHGDTDWEKMTEGIVERVMLSAESAASAYVWCGHRQFGRLIDSFETAGWKTRPVVWRKLCPVPAPPGVGWDSALEMCVYAFRSGRKWTPSTGTKVPNVIDADSYRHGQPGKVGHPTQKPLVTARLPIEYSTEAGDTVLDPFMGSGTTLRAAKDLGRKAIGIEIEEKYCEIAAERLAQEVLDLGAAA